MVVRCNMYYRRIKRINIYLLTTIISQRSPSSSTLSVQLTLVPIGLVALVNVSADRNLFSRKNSAVEGDQLGVHLHVELFKLKEFKLFLATATISFSKLPERINLTQPTPTVSIRSSEWAFLNSRCRF